MAKRRSGSEEESPHRKRQRIIETLLSKEDPIEIQEVQNLQLLLAFEQDAGPHARQKIQIFKSFLDSIAYGKESDERSRKRAILLEYLQSQTAQGIEDSSVHVPDFIQTWHFAVQSDVEGLCSSVAAAVALLLKTISGSIEFRKSGKQLCRFLLEDNQMKLFEKGLGTSRMKEHLISPCLRLLTEIVSFDGGYAAGAVFRQRGTTFNRLDVFLTMRKDAYGGEAESRRKPSVRKNALRFLFANLRLQKPAAKMSILGQGKLVRALFEGVTKDSYEDILEVLHVLKKDVALDSALSNHAKVRFFNEWSLSRLASLYSYDEIDENYFEQRASVQVSVHSFLMFLCSSPGHGVFERLEGDVLRAEDTELRTPHNVDNEDPQQITLHRGKQLHGRNDRLASFLQGLRPYANVLQSELILAVFHKVPHLMSDYFNRKKNFFFDPKATATWIGFSSFLIAAIQLPVPESLIDSKNNGSLPPPSDKVFASIMPQVLTQKVLTRGVNQSTNLIKFFTINILIAAFNKLEDLLRLYRSTQNANDSESHTNAWSQAAFDLTTQFCGQIPDIEHVVAQFRSCPKGCTFLHQSLTHSLALYYRILPHIALEAKLDISLTLSDTLHEHPKENGIQLLARDDMLEIARCSPSIQWWHKSEKMALSPFTTLLQLQVESRRTDPRHRQFWTLLAAVIEENQLLDPNESGLSLEVLILSLQSDGNWNPSSAVYEFLDNCVLRFVRRPVFYYELFSEFITTADNATKPCKGHIDLLLIAILEQWPFLSKSADVTTITNVTTWLIRYIELSSLRIQHNAAVKPGEGATLILVRLRDRLRNDVHDDTCRLMLDASLREPPELGMSFQPALSTSTGEHRQSMVETLQIDEAQSKQFSSLIPLGPPEEQENHSGLNKWTRQDVQDAITDGEIEELFLCLCSKFAEIRQQALISITMFMGKLEASGDKGWLQIYLAAGELKETAGDSVTETPVPSLAPVLAARILMVVTDPLHFLYVKINKFMMRGPRWDVAKLASYWVDRILLKPPTEDNAHYLEAEWLLDLLIDGLRTPRDFQLYRSCNVFERIFSFSASPPLPEQCFQKILELLFRCTYVEGSTTLITRCALVDWVSSGLTLRGSKGITKARLRTLAVRAYETSDQAHVDEWSDGTMHATLDNIQISEFQ